LIFIMIGLNSLTKNSYYIMIDKDLHTALFELEKNLQDLSSAKQQIDEIKKISSDVVSAISNIQEKYSKHLANIEETHNLNLENYKKVIDAFVSNLENEFNNIVLLSKENITAAKNEFSQLITNQKEEINKYHLELISSTKDLINHSIENLNKSTESHDALFNNQDKKIRQHLNSYQGLIDKVAKLLDYIDKIDFPSRLDKIDNTISSINIGLQNLQGIVNDIQREQPHRFEQIEKLVNEKINWIQKKQEKLAKRNRLFFIILVAIIVISTIIIKFA